MAGSVSADAPANAVMQLAQNSDGFEVERVYMQNCWACHNSGAAGAPKVGNAADWAPRVQKGMDTLLANATNGLNAMPAKGLCFTCTEDDLKALIQYMVDSSK
ncbi:MAG: cytochrome c5 family protein [Pseudomonadales bacterium]|nr:cytochrome c5 family protein [Pseudomonadales bacterium]MCP5344126.1 cytochrome c5 family protein [Pseudomonadales bacterium]